MINQLPVQDQRKQIGEICRSRRLELQLSLKDIENATSIRTVYLQAIEEGEIQKLLSPVYARGFIKQYASYINLEADKLLQEFPYAFDHQEKQEFDYGIGTLEIRNLPGNGVKSLPNIVWIISFVGLLVAAWYLAKSLNLF